MADLADVEQKLASMASAAVYPNGTSNPNASVAGVTITLARGWPEPGGKQLDAIIAAGNAMITVFSAPGMGANTTRFLQQMSPRTSVPPAQLTLTVASNQIIVGGAINAGEAACVNVNYQAYSYGVKSSDTPQSIAAGLAAAIPGATASGAVVTLAGAFEIQASVSVPVQMQQEIGRQTRVFMITAWCPLPPMRDTIIGAIDDVFMLQSNKRILLPDNTLARLSYRGTSTLDDLAKQNIYRRDTRYEVEYVTTSTEIDNTVSNLAVGIAPAGGVTSTINI
jgi:hypothetical protein